jgi:catechol 2,3-dioxygenase-like lactoylglutathione lyase family enzyme
MGITHPWKNTTQRPLDPAFRCWCPSHLVQISFRSRALSRTRSHRTYNHHPIRRYRRTPGRLNFRHRIRHLAVSDNSVGREGGGIFQVDRIDHVGFTAHDVEGLARWYEAVFGMQRAHAEVWSDVEGGHPLVLCAGSVCIALFARREGVEPRPVVPADPNEHVGLIVDQSNFETAKQELDAQGIDYTTWDHDICDSIYFFDPEGHQIELTVYRT